MVKSKEQLLDYIENSVLVYSSINDYGKQTFADGGDYSEEDFEEDTLDGFIENITLGTYNGATKETHYRRISKYHLYDALLNYLKETDFGDVWYLEEELEGEELTEEKMIEGLIDLYPIIQIDNQIYLDRS